MRALTDVIIRSFEHIRDCLDAKGASEMRE